MSKKAILTLCSLFSTQIFCAEAGELAIVTKILERAHVTAKNSKLTTDQEAQEHAVVNKAAFGFPEQFTPEQQAQFALYYARFPILLRTQYNALVSARSTKEDVALLAGAFGTRWEGPQPSIELPGGSTAWQLNCIYVTPEKQRRLIGTSVIKEFERYTQEREAGKAISIILFMLRNNTEATEFFEKNGFKAISGEYGLALLKLAGGKETEANNAETLMGYKKELAAAAQQH